MLEYVEGKETPGESGLLTSPLELEIGVSDRDIRPSGPVKREEKPAESSREVEAKSGEYKRSSDLKNAPEITRTFSKISAGENELTERSSDRTVREIPSEGFARALGIEPGIGEELFGARHQSRRSATSTRGAPEGESHRVRLFGACTRRITSDDAHEVGALRIRSGGSLRTSNASGTHAHDFRSPASHHLSTERVLGLPRRDGGASEEGLQQSCGSDSRRDGIRAPRSSQLS